MMILLQFAIAFIIYFAIVMGAYYATEVKELPKWLQFPPFHCRKCLTFWSNLAAGLTIGLAFNLYVTMATVAVMAVLTAIAMHVDQKRKTIKIEDDDDDWICYKFDEKGEIIYKKPLINPNEFDVEINGDIITVTPKKK